MTQSHPTIACIQLGFPRNKSRCATRQGETSSPPKKGRSKNNAAHKQHKPKSHPFHPLCSPCLFWDTPRRRSVYLRCETQSPRRDSRRRDGGGVYVPPAVTPPVVLEGHRAGSKFPQRARGPRVNLLPGSQSKLLRPPALPGEFIGGPLTGCLGAQILLGRKRGGRPRWTHAGRGGCWGRVEARGHCGFGEEAPGCLSLVGRGERQGETAGASAEAPWEESFCGLSVGDGKRGEGCG